MPEICRFSGIRVTMYSGEREHPPPHFHAQVGAQRAVFQISNGLRMAGKLPIPAERLLRRWLAMNQTALEENWRLARLEKPLNSIPPL